MPRFIIKRNQDLTPSLVKSKCSSVTPIDEKDIPMSEVKESDKKAKRQRKETNNTINESVMTTSEKIELAANVLGGSKRLKTDKGLIERAESSKIVLTEDNKELLID